MTEKTREFKFTKRDFDFIRRISNERTGIVVSDEKFDMFYARLSRRVRELGLKSFSQYCDLLKNDAGGDEVLELVNAVTTNLTAFFRENHHFEYLQDTVLPQLRKINKADHKIRIWSAGCSTGEEPYSLAITLRETIAANGGWDARILATDIDSSVLSRASKGVYAIDRVNGIPKARLRRWFMKGHGQQKGLVRSKPEIRSLIDFAQLNLMEDWTVDGPMDLIFCRNVIIYFDRDTKIKLINRYADNLKEGGYLFVGHSESLFKICDRFELIGNTIYRKTG
ncbi:Chemotaxis protein methyltransferase CheR [hydrothermal vent metagenome]|uniref:protein-glutamate O-methyltransferase n=1 Tax=hydrothermal vent metagenome TaxID=652676 RepID=A0A3B1B0W1_9ZZZZ